MRSLFLLMCCFGFGSGLYAGDEAQHHLVNRRLIGFSAQQGLSYYRLPEGRYYQASGLVASFHQPFFKTRKRVNAGITVSPQIWLGYAHQTAAEAGLNASLNMNVQCGKLSVISFDIGSGFHYFGLSTSRQAKGFTFANNFLVHFRHLLGKDPDRSFYLGFLTGFRHLSNLDLQMPNGGIDNVVLGLSFGRAY